MTAQLGHAADRGLEPSHPERSPVPGSATLAWTSWGHAGVAARAACSAGPCRGSSPRTLLLTTRARLLGKVAGDQDSFSHDAPRREPRSPERLSPLGLAAPKSSEPPRPVWHEASGRFRHAFHALRCAPGTPRPHDLTHHMPPIGFYQSSELGAHHGQPQTPRQTLASAAVRRSIRGSIGRFTPFEGWSTRLGTTPPPRRPLVVADLPPMGRGPDTPCRRAMTGAVGRTTRTAVRKPPRENRLAELLGTPCRAPRDTRRATSRNGAREA
jgi:hypothetical protein